MHCMSGRSASAMDPGSGHPTLIRASSRAPSYQSPAVPVTVRLLAPITRAVVLEIEPSPPATVLVRGVRASTLSVRPDAVLTQVSVCTLPSVTLVVPLTLAPTPRESFEAERPALAVDADDLDLVLPAGRRAEALAHDVVVGARDRHMA